MSKERLAELLAYAFVCFEHCTTPFELTHLRKKNVRADECVELSYQIAGAIEDLGAFLIDKWNELLKEAHQEFEETQSEGFKTI